MYWFWYHLWPVISFPATPWRVIYETLPWGHCWMLGKGVWVIGGRLVNKKRPTTKWQCVQLKVEWFIKKTGATWGFSRKGRHSDGSFDTDKGYSSQMSRLYGQSAKGSTAVPCDNVWFVAVPNGQEAKDRQSSIERYGSDRVGQAIKRAGRNS